MKTEVFVVCDMIMNKTVPKCSALSPFARFGWRLCAFPRLCRACQPFCDLPAPEPDKPTHFVQISGCSIRRTNNFYRK